MPAPIFRLGAINPIGIGIDAQTAKVIMFIVKNKNKLIKTEVSLVRQLEIIFICCSEKLVV